MNLNQIKKIEFNPYKIFEENNEKFLYSIENNGIYKIDDKLISLLDQDGKSYEDAYNSVADLYESDEYESVIKNMYESEFIKKEINNETIKLPRDIQNTDHIKGITLMIVQECNLRCTYCYGDGGEYADKGKMELGVALKAVDFLVENSIDKNVSICFLGGEPLLNFLLIKKVVEYCKEKESNKIFRFTLTTNGTIINDEIERFLRKNNISMQISIDGQRDVHDQNRHYSKGIGSYDKVIEKTKNMRADGLLSARATITNVELRISKIFEHLESLGFKRIPMAPAQNILSDNDYKTLIKEYAILIDLFENYIKKKDFKKASKISVLWSGLQKINTGINRRLTCGVGRTMYTIDINGDIFPCHRFVANKEYIIGNLDKGVQGRADFLKEIDLANHKQCEKCWVKNLCVGACPNENLVNMGSTQISSDKNCELTKSMYEGLLKVYIRLTEAEKNIIFGLDKGVQKNE